MNITTFQKKIVVISTIVTSLLVIGGAAVQAYNVIDDTIVTKRFFTERMQEKQKRDDIAINDLRLLIIEQGLSGYYAKGIDKLSDLQKHRYDKLILAEATNEARRNELLGR